MRGRDFLGPARDLIAGPTEAHRRAAAGRAYYGAFQEANASLKRWGIAIPPRENVHSAVRLRFAYASHPDAQKIGRWLDELVQLRNEADYKLAIPGSFSDTKLTSNAIAKAIALIDLLDAIESDPSRRAAIVASIRP